MMHMPWVLVTLMVPLLLIAAGVYLAVRILGAKQAKDDHPPRRSEPRA